MAPRQYVDISHFRAPYKNWPYLGMGGFGQTDPSMPIDVSPPAVPDAAAVTPVAPAPIDPNALSASLVTIDANGVKTLIPAAGLALLTAFQSVFVAPFTTAADKEQVIGPSVNMGVALPSATSWVNAQLARGRSVIVSANMPGGLVDLMNPARPPMSGAFVLASVSTKADEILAAGPSQPNAALIAPSKLKPASPLENTLQKAGMGPASVALIALVVVGGGILLITRKPKRAVANRRRSRR